VLARAYEFPAYSASRLPELSAVALQPLRVSCSLRRSGDRRNTKAFATDAETSLDEVTYSVTRAYFGIVNRESKDISVVEGHMEMYAPDAGLAAEDTRARNVLNQWSGEVLSSSASNTIGYFALDKVPDPLADKEDE